MEGMELTLPQATRNFYVDGHEPQPHWHKEVFNVFFFFLNRDYDVDFYQGVARWSEICWDNSLNWLNTFSLSLFFFFLQAITSLTIKLENPWNYCFWDIHFSQTFSTEIFHKNGLLYKVTCGLDICVEIHVVNISYIGIQFLNHTNNFLVVQKLSIAWKWDIIEN